MYDESPTAAPSVTPAGGRVQLRADWQRFAPWLWVGVPWLWYGIRDAWSWFDVVAILMPVLVVVAIGVALIRARAHLTWASVAIVLSLVAFFAATVFSPWRPVDRPAPEDPITVAALNVGAYWFSDNDAGFFAFQRQPDVLIGTELSESHDAEFLSRFDHTVSDIIPLSRQQANDAGAEPTGEGYRRYGFPSLGVYANFPLQQLEDPIADVVDGGLPGFRVRVDAPDHPFVLYALHIPRPGTGNGVYEVTPGEQRHIVEQINLAVEAEELPVVVMGDLNSVDRGGNYRALRANLVDGMRSDNWAIPTSDRGLPYTTLLLRIDHLLMSESWCSTNAGAEDTRFSDHRPIYADIGPCP